MAGAGKGWEHSSVSWSQERWFDLRKWKPASQYHFCLLFYILWHLIIRMPSSACSLTWVRVWRQKVGICYCCWKKLTCYSFSVSKGFYWLTVLSFFFLSQIKLAVFEILLWVWKLFFLKKNLSPLPKMNCFPVRFLGSQAGHQSSKAVQRMHVYK